MPDITEYTLSCGVSEKTVFALVSDLHNRPYEEFLSAVRERKPDFVLAPGDILERTEERQDMGLAFLTGLAREFPVFYAPGNHERDIDRETLERIRKTGAVWLENASARLGKLNIGGISGEFELTDEARAFLDAFCLQGGVRILLCHQPDRYFHYIRNYDIPVVVSGHAHGGQIRIFGQGLFAPQQGIFPKWTSGVHENRLVVSRGLANHTIVPRLWTRPEVCFVTLTPKQ